MEYDDEDEVYTFASGRTFYANNGIIGLGPDGGLYEGYDGLLWDLPESDRIELADYMIAAWERFKTGE